MAENSKIEWTDHTFNPWIGCQKVSPGCDHCYAESMAKRYGWVTWGQRKTEDTAPSVGERKRTSEANWKKPRRWNTMARESGKRPRVFCASLADVFDNQVPVQWRADLFDLVAATAHLDWLLLTKRPQNIARLMPTGWWGNVWLGTTCEDQERYDERILHLLAVNNVPVHFVSYEPAIGPLRLHNGPDQPDWLICGGESGPGARMMDPAWAAAIKTDCETTGTYFFMKQMTGKKPIPDHLMLREFPRAA